MFQYRRRDSNPQNLGFEPSTYANSVTSADKKRGQINHNQPLHTKKLQLRSAWDVSRPCRVCRRRFLPHMHLSSVFPIVQGVPTYYICFSQGSPHLSRVEADLHEEIIDRVCSFNHTHLVRVATIVPKYLTDLPLLCEVSLLSVPK